MKQFGLGGMGEEKCEKVRKEGQMKEKSEKVLKRGARRGESSHQGGSINSNGGNIPTIFTMKLVVVLNSISVPS